MSSADLPVAPTAFAAGVAYVRGQFVPMAEATISVLDWGFTRSDVVYDVVHVFNGGFFRLKDHLDRFEASMAARRLVLPENRPRIEAILHECVARSGLGDSYVAMVASRGRPKIFGSRRPVDCENHLICYAIPWIDVIPKDVQARGARLWIAGVPRVADASVDPTVKNYQWNDLTTGLLEAHDHGYDTAVLCDADGFVTEGPGFNIFVIRDGKVLTPDRGSLHGITRKSVIELCTDLGLQAEVTAIPRAALEDADEIFAATTAGGVMPCSELGSATGHRILGNGAPGTLSMQLKELYWQKHRDGWHRTAVRSALNNQ